MWLMALMKLCSLILMVILASEAGHLLAGEGENPEELQLPPFIADLAGNTFTLLLKVTPYNFSGKHQTFTVSHILDERERAPLPDFVADASS
ncbi:unnamed protein product [Brassica oleracea]